MPTKPVRLLPGSSAERREKVERLKELIARGEYNPDPEEVARAMLERGF